jgi:purine-nucleoside phosphorylase
MIQPNELFDRVERAAEAVRERAAARSPTVGLILGSGLGGFADQLAAAVRIPYADIPGFPTPRVEGHSGRLVLGALEGVSCVAMQGRAHYYEGHDMATVTLAVRTMIRLGTRTLIITNAAGGLNPSFNPGTLMVIRDHINLFPEHPLRGTNDDRLGPRFPDMTYAYAPDLRQLARDAAAAVGVNLAQGVYAGLPGPCYETPAEVQMLHRLGADAAGMSTVPEVIVANHMGAAVLGISCITNPAAGQTQARLSHDEVTATAARIRTTFESLLTEIVRRIGQAHAESRDR